MRFNELNTTYLYEGLERSEKSSMVLWETAGIRLTEAQLTQAQILQIFQQIEQGATSAGGNRTLLGKGKDAATAVNAAWEDLKSKVQSSAPIKAVDQKYDDAVAKIEKGLGGPNNAVNKVIQRYRKFAKDHPIAQGLIYSALIAAAGISGAGLGGAAVLGLLKMTDKLLQGEKFSSAAYSGAKTGAMAYGASKIGDYIKNKPSEPLPGAVKPDDYDMGDTPSSSSTSFSGTTIANEPVIPGKPLSDTQMAVMKMSMDSGNTYSPEIMAQYNSQLGKATKAVAQSATDAAADTSSDVAAKVTAKAADAIPTAPTGAGMSPEYLQKVIDAGGKSGERFMITPDAAQKALDWQAQNGGQLSSAAADAAAKASDGFSKEYLQKIISGEHPRPMISKEKAAELLKNMESVVRSGKQLSEGQVYLIINRITSANNQSLTEGTLIEGPADWVKSGMKKLKTVGHNLTTKVTADKLTKAWNSAGSPLDSDQVYKFLKSQGVNDQVISQVYAGMKLQAPSTTKTNLGALGNFRPGNDKNATQPATASASTTTPAVQTQYSQIKQQLAQLDKKSKRRLQQYLQKQLGTV